MKNNTYYLFFLFLLLGCNQIQESFKTELTTLAHLTTRYPGVSAAFCGIHNDYIFVAGGCNFPNISAAEGGEKIYYDDIYILHKDSIFTEKWRKVGSLPFPIAYGATVSTKDGILCIGGMNNEKRLNKVFLLGYDTILNNIFISDSPSLPFTLDNAAAVLCDNKVYVAGGNKSGIPSNLLLSLDTKTYNEWIVVDTIPGYPRVQPVLISNKTQEYYGILVQSGFYHSFDTTVVHTDGYLYIPESKKWSKLSGPTIEENEISLSGGIGFTLNDSLSICFGGVNKNIFQYGLRISGQYATAQKENKTNIDSLKTLVNDYMNAEISFYEFNSNHWLYNSITDEWIIVGNSLATALAGASGVAIDKNHIILINGELKPGIRTNAVNLITIKKETNSNK